MQVCITAKYQDKEEISECLHTVSKALEDLRDHHSLLYSYSDEDIKVIIEPMDKSDTLSSEYELEKFINRISDRLEFRSASHLHNQQ